MSNAEDRKKREAAEKREEKRENARFWKAVEASGQYLDALALVDFRIEWEQKEAEARHKRLSAADRERIERRDSADRERWRVHTENRERQERLGGFQIGLGLVIIVFGLVVLGIAQRGFTDSGTEFYLVGLGLLLCLYAYTVQMQRRLKSEDRLAEEHHKEERLKDDKRYAARKRKAAREKKKLEGGQN